MADNVYLLETRLSPSQQTALAAVRDVARQSGLTVFLVGGAVRDLISGSPVRDLDFAVQGAAMELRKTLEEAGGAFSGENLERQALYLRFPGGVRVELSSTLSATYPKPGQPVYQSTSILDDLRRRDFTANAMALSLNDGSYGLLMDPLNGVADIENRELRLVSNYGFIEDPVRMIRAARLMARLGWQMEERTRSRYETGKEERYIDAMQAAERAYELEEIFHEEDPLRVMRRLEEEGWLTVLSPSLNVAKANVVELGRLREVQLQFQTRGVMADAAAANFPLLTAKLSPAEVEAIRATFPRVGFTEEIQSLESSAKELVTRVVSKEMAAPSAAYRFLLQAPSATVVYAAYSSRSAAFQAKVKSFLTDWPTAQSRIPYALMAEMRIVPELANYPELLERLFYAFMDGQLESTEEIRAFLEPYSPPAPPPPISLRRPRTPRKEAKSAKGKKKAAHVAVIAAEEEEQAGETPVAEIAKIPAAPVRSAAETGAIQALAGEEAEGKEAILAKKPAKTAEAKPKSVEKTVEAGPKTTVAKPKPTSKPEVKGKAVVAEKGRAAAVPAKATRPAKAAEKGRRASEVKRAAAKPAHGGKRPAPAKKATVKRVAETKPTKRTPAAARPVRSPAKKTVKKAAKKVVAKGAPARSVVPKTAAKVKAKARR